ncbi:MAG: Hint domain-containing protein, partial [Rhodobacteraceae bacterium]|nr:Hint domain-containing protein [Paracoccaceae bacterium]
MATTIFTSTDIIELNGFTDHGTTASWSSTGHATQAFPVVDHNEDGDLDSTGSPDHFGGVPYSGYTVEIGGNTYAIFLLGGKGYIPYDVAFDDLTAQSIPTSTSDKSENGTAQNFCFAAGTGIATPAGETTVDELQIGDTILTADGSAVTVKWIGHQTVRPVLGLMNQRLEPVRICAGALGQGLPLADLTVTADHGVVIDDLVINASALVNGSTINFVPVAELDKEFTYYHIETQDHDVILANGAAAETFVDVAGRSGFDNHQEYLDLYGAE